MYEIFYRALGGKVQSKDGLSNIVQRQTGGAASLPPLTTEPMLPPPPPPKTIYDPVREIEAERRARELQTRKIAELGTAPQQEQSVKHYKLEVVFTEMKKGQSEMQWVIYKKTLDLIM